MIGWGTMLALQLFTAAVAFRFDRESMRPLWRLPLQQFAYRQLMYLVLIQSVVTAMTGGRLRWHKLHRAGLGGPRSAQEVPATASVRPLVPSQGLAPAIDSWPPVLDQQRAPVHPAAGRATARPPVPSQARPAQTRPSQASPAQTRPSQTSPTQTRPSQVSPAQTRPSQAGPGQVAPTRQFPVPDPSAGS